MKFPKFVNEISKEPAARSNGKLQQKKKQIQRTPYTYINWWDNMLEFAVIRENLKHETNTYRQS